jgi:signal transduction histidine kinase
MTTAKAIKISTLSLIASIGLRYSSILLEGVRQDSLTKDLCGLVSLPLETGLLRDAHEGLENALKARNETNACVSVTDNGRSYSPDCIKNGIAYRMAMCKAQGNTGVRAAIYYEQRNLFEAALAYLWAVIFVIATVGLALVNISARVFIHIFSGEVNQLLNQTNSEETNKLLSHRIAAWLLLRLGISDSINERAREFHRELEAYEEQIAAAAIERTRFEEQTKGSERYAEKVKQIRHDIRSPLSSLQAIYEQLKFDSGATTRALATAIRRIQLLMDDLNQVDHVREEPKLAIAEVVVEEIVLAMAPKFRETKSATLGIEYKREELSPIKVGVREFQSAIENLLENALDAISVGGRVIVNISSDGSRCKISVEDNGSGISSDNIAKLFTRGGSFGKLNGSGLGLFHTKHDVESWGGTVICEPLNRGIRFTIELPLMQTGVVFSGLPTNRRIKIIDDDGLVPATLKRTGFEILESAATFEDGKKILANGTSDEFSIFVDQQLENNNLGTDLIAGQPGRRKIFLCTNDFDDLGVVKLAREIGVKIIPKPLCFFEEYHQLSATPPVL